VSSPLPPPSSLLSSLSPFSPLLLLIPPLLSWSFASFSSRVRYWSYLPKESEEGSSSSSPSFSQLNPSPEEQVCPPLLAPLSLFSPLSYLLSLLSPSLPLSLSPSLPISSLPLFLLAPP
jgi:hypothetical protein